MALIDVLRARRGSSFPVAPPTDMGLDVEYPSYDIMPAAQNYMRGNQRLAQEMRESLDTEMRPQATTVDKIGSLLALAAVAAQAAKGNKRQIGRIPGQVAGFVQARSERRKQTMTEARQKVMDRLSLQEMLGGLRGRSFGVLSEATRTANERRQSEIKRRMDEAEAKRLESQTASQVEENEAQAELARQRAKREDREFNRYEALWTARQAALPAAQKIAAAGGPQTEEERLIYYTAYPQSEYGEVRLPHEQMEIFSKEEDEYVAKEVESYRKYLLSAEGAEEMWPRKLRPGVMEKPDAVYDNRIAAAEESARQRYRINQTKFGTVYGLALQRQQEREAALEEQREQFAALIDLMKSHKPTPVPLGELPEKSGILGFLQRIARVTDWLQGW